MARTLLRAPESHRSIAKMVEKPKAKCAHEGCTCTVHEGQTYCSPHCATAAAETVIRTDEPCQCGHEACKAIQRTILR
jgi:hypothetical protein